VTATTKTEAAIGSPRAHLDVEPVEIWAACKCHAEMRDPFHSDLQVQGQRDTKPVPWDIMS